MRRLFGIAALASGLVALGWYVTQFSAASIEREVASAAAEVVEGYKSVDATVSGRDITLTGIVAGEEKHAALLAAVEAIPGHRVIRDETEVLAAISPYVLTVNWNGAPASLKGYIPAEEARGEFGRVLGPAAGVLEVAAGAPDENWTSFALQGLSALRPLKSASLRISDTELVLTGVAPNPAARAAVDAALAGLPEGYNATVDVRTEDDGQPFGF
ncbi:MAG: hypothetical protein AAGI10_13850, partial [Pseudomonadota bacterium]